MRKLLSLLCIGATLLLSCEKADLMSDVSRYAIGSYLGLVDAENLLLDASDAAASTVSVVVRPVGSALEKVNVYAVEGGPDPDESHWKLVKTVMVTDSVFQLAVNGAELATALGISIAEIQPGSQYTFYNETVTTDGRTYDISNTEDDLEGQPSFNSVFSWTATVVCPFTNNMVGEYTIVLDEWDGNNGGAIQIEAGPGANEITLKTPFPFALNAKDIIVQIDPVTGTATVASQVYGGYAGFPDISVKTVGANNFVFSCTETIDLTLNHTSAAGNFGDYRMVIQK